jgi:hypothetical protein
MTQFETVIEIIGNDKALELMQRCGGFVFYIPLKPYQAQKFKARAQHLRAIGYSEGEITNALSIEFEKTKKTIKLSLRKKHQGGLFED